MTLYSCEGLKEIWTSSEVGQKFWNPSGWLRLIRTQGFHDQADRKTWVSAGVRAFQNAHLKWYYTSTALICTEKFICQGALAGEAEACRTWSRADLPPAITLGTSQTEYSFYPPSKKMVVRFLLLCFFSHHEGPVPTLLSFVLSFLSLLSLPLPHLSIVLPSNPSLSVKVFIPSKTTSL